ncbi:hypothetical protein ZIOFF_030047 [Zingiber officinale]|uniref:Asn/Gln amidotransferase domain-containing protein n=1 Tax=Zingiber officinale TaxID=94328 RepID=A0A8J5L4L8_ZINOF|nr:hypothetical protein ZIOFF_030047 [Zingiber officinale]
MTLVGVDPDRVLCHACQSDNSFPIRFGPDHVFCHVLLHSQGQNDQIFQETRLWEEGAQKTFTMRKKEGLADYRYFPEPDLPEVVLTKEFVDKLSQGLPELPEAKRRRYEKMGLAMQDALFLANDNHVAEFFDASFENGADPKLSANWIMGDISAFLKNERLSITEIKLTPFELSELIASIKNGTISGKIGKEILFDLLAKGETVQSLIEEKDLVQAKASFSTISPPVFDGDNYQIWAVRMETYLDALDLWEALDVDYEIPVLPANPTMAQIKVHKEKKTKKSKAKACLFAAVSATIFSRIMSLQTTKEIWDYLKSEYEGDERIRGMQVLNLIRDFEMQKMKKTETIKEYADRLLGIANRVRLLGSSLTDSRIVEKILVTLPERFEATITTFENTKDLTKITLAELLNALQAQEQRRAMRREGEIEGALPARHNDVGNFRK